jgi:hypothetical protein
MISNTNLLTGMPQLWSLLAELEKQKKLNNEKAE